MSSTAASSARRSRGGCIGRADDRCRLRGRRPRPRRSPPRRSRLPDRGRRSCPSCCRRRRPAAAAETPCGCLAVDQPLQGLAVHLQGASESRRSRTAAAAAGRRRRASPAPPCAPAASRCGCLRSSPYAASRRQRSSSGASSGRPAIRIGSTFRSGNASPRRRRSAFSRRTITGSRSFGRDLDAAGEALRVEHLEQRREAVGVAVVRRGGQEQAVLETRGQLAHRPRELAGDRVARAAGRRGVVRLVEDEQRARAEIAEHVAQARRRRSHRRAGCAR